MGHRDSRQFPLNNQPNIEPSGHVRKAEVDEERKETRLQGLKHQFATAEGDEAEELCEEIEELEGRIDELTEFKPGQDFYASTGSGPWAGPTLRYKGKIIRYSGVSQETVGGSNSALQSAVRCHQNLRSAAPDLAGRSHNFRITNRSLPYATHLRART